MIILGKSILTWICVIIITLSAALLIDSFTDKANKDPFKVNKGALVFWAIAFAILIVGIFIFPIWCIIELWR